MEAHCFLKMHLYILIPFWNITNTEYNIEISMSKIIYTKEYKYFTGQLKRARQEAGLDQKKAGKIIGKTQSYISKIESGQIRIDVVQLKEFTKIYKKDLDFFIKK